jgi:NitT/TauT family transport system substrate-binding protein
LRALIIFVILAFVMFFSLGCISPEKKAPELTTLRIGYQTTTHHVAEMVASEFGWWAKDLLPFGVKEIKEFEYPSGTPELKAMQSGDLDVIYVCTSPLLPSLSKGLDGKVVAAVNDNGSNLVFRPGLNYNGPGSLRGLSIATFPPGTAQDILLKKWLMDADVNISEVKIYPMGPGDAVEAISMGKVDAVFLPHPGPAIIEMAGNGKSVLASGEMWPRHACCGIVVSGRLIRDYPDLVAQIVKTQIRATDYINANPEVAARIYSNHTGQDAKMAEYSIKSWDGHYISDPYLLINSTMEYAKFQFKMNYIQKELTKEEIFDTGFYDKVK